MRVSSGKVLNDRVVANDLDAAFIGLTSRLDAVIGDWADRFGAPRLDDLVGLHHVVVLVLEDVAVPDVFTGER